MILDFDDVRSAFEVAASFNGAYGNHRSDAQTLYNSADPVVQEAFKTAVTALANARNAMEASQLRAVISRAELNITSAKRSLKELGLDE